MTYGEIRRLSAGLAGFLEGGPRPDRTAILVGSPFLFTQLYLAAFRLGLTLLPLDPAMPRANIARLLRAAQVTLVVTDQPEIVESDVPCLQVAEGYFGGLIGDADEEALDRWTPPADGRHVVLYTSGTTGSTPKGVILSRSALLTNSRNIAQRMEVDRPSRFLGVLPLHHTNGQVFNTLLPALTGSVIFCHQSFGLPFFSSFWTDVNECRIEYVDMVPTVIRTLLSLPPIRPPDVSSLKYLVCGGAPLPAEVLEEFQNRFGVVVLQEYGLTEGTCVSVMEGPSDRRRGTVGLPLLGTFVEVRDQDGRMCEPGRRGEIFLQSDCAMIGYLGGPQGTGVTQRGDWLATGDIGTLDDDGFLTITGRLKNVIIKGGENIFPEDVERVAHRCEFVRDAMARGVPDEFFGENVVLMIVWRDGLPREAELRRVLDENLPPHWQPSRFTSVDSIPRNSSGKILRHFASASGSGE